MSFLKTNIWNYLFLLIVGLGYRLNDLFAN